MKSLFITTKPLQLIITLSIVDQLEQKKPKDLIIVNYFSGALDTYKNAQTNLKQFEKLYFIEKKYTKLKLKEKHKYDEIYIDSDVGLKNYVYLLILKFKFRNSRICVYEEGVGTYRKSIFKNWKSIIYKILGIGMNFGSCVHTDRIYLYHPEEYESIKTNKSLEVIKIKKSVQECISQNLTALESIFESIQIKNETNICKNCNIYLTNWEPDINFISHMGELSGDNYIKFHPHIKRYKKFESVGNINPNIPSELLLIKLVNIYERINVYHHNSSTAQYIKHHKISFINIENSQE